MDTDETFFRTLPEGYTVVKPTPIARSTRNRFSRPWYFMLRDLYEGGGYGWQHWGGGHTTSGITKAVVSRGYVERAESPKGALLFRLTRRGVSKLMELYEEYGEAADQRGVEYVMPTPPEGAPLQPLREPQPEPDVEPEPEPQPTTSVLDEARQVLDKAESFTNGRGRRVWARCGHPAELDINNDCYTCHKAVA